jgi:hypothetical protein
VAKDASARHLREWSADIRLLTLREQNLLLQLHLQIAKSFGYDFIVHL